MSIAPSPTRQVGLIGWPVEHSLSPHMFKAAFAHLGLDWQYTAFAIPPQELAQRVGDLQEQGIRGFNVTVPHKQAIMDVLDTIQPEARSVGAVNTVIAKKTNNGIMWIGTNTDVAGFAADIAHLIGSTGTKSTAMILGAGGAARAAAFALAQMDYEVLVASRTPTRGLSLVRDVQAGLMVDPTKKPEVESTIWRMQMRSIPWERIGALAPEVDLVVNCTPVGMWPHIEASPWPKDVPFPEGITLYDMVYRPANTLLMQQAIQAGGKAYNGLGMLVRQGAAAFELWTGKTAPFEIMLQAAQAALL